MIDKHGAKWNKEETILAFELYCRTPFGKITQTNPDIIELAKILGRTPGSVGLKMHNLAHYDPELQKRNVSAMAHTSKLDEEVFVEFYDNWGELAYRAQVLRAKMQHIEISQLAGVEDDERIPAGEYKERLVKTRLGQHFFRMAVLNSYGRRCCVTGLTRVELLIASHIKPWNVSDEIERTNPRNGLCLNSLHDKAFDKGLMTLDNKYRIILSKKIKETAMDIKTREWLLNYENKQILLPEKFLPGKEFIKYHNDMIFIG